MTGLKVADNKPIVKSVRPTGTIWSNYCIVDSSIDCRNGIGKFDHFAAHVTLALMES